MGKVKSRLPSVYLREAVMNRTIATMSNFPFCNARDESNTADYASLTSV